MSLLAIFVAASIAFAIGAVWYSPFLFGKPWMRLSGNNEGMHGTRWIIPSIVMLVGLMIAAYVLAMVQIAMGAFSTATGMESAFWCWLGFAASHGIMQTLFEHRSIKLYFINTGYFLVALLTMGAILAVW